MDQDFNDTKTLRISIPGDPCLWRDLWIYFEFEIIFTLLPRST